MSDKEQALAFLQVAADTCSVALAALADKETDIKEGETGENVSLDLLLKDYSSLLSLIYQNTSKLSIALKPSSPTYSASNTPLKELRNHIDALTSCACAISASEHGRTFVKAVRLCVEEVVRTLHSLLGVFIADAQTPRAGLADAYLVRTGAVHEAIDHARATPRTNVEAVRRRWEDDIGGIGDCVEEVQEMVDDEESSRNEAGNNNDGGNHGFTEDDGWGDLGIELSSGMSVKATAEELARLKSACHLLKFTQALQKRILSTLLYPRATVEIPRPSILDDLLSYSNSLLKASDDLVHALYLPQDSTNLSSRVKSYRGILEALCGQLGSLALTSSISWTSANLTGELSQRIALMNLQSDDQTERLTKERKWLDACFTQIFRSADTIVGSGKY